MTSSKLTVRGVRAFGLSMAIGLIALFFIGDAFAAANTIADIADNTRGQLDSIKALAMSAFFLVGLVLFGVGLFLFYKDSKEQGRGHAKNGLIALLVGVALMAIPALAAITAESTVGDSSQPGIESTYDAAEY